jgi:hypothetical protein
VLLQVTAFQQLGWIGPRIYGNFSRTSRLARPSKPFAINTSQWRNHS